MRLLRLLMSEIPEQNRKMILVMTVASAISTTLLLMLVSSASRAVSEGKSSTAVAMRYVITLAVFAVSQNYVMIAASQEVERLLHRLRLRLFHAIRQADLVTVETIGRGALHSAMIQETQTLAQTAPMLILGGQQAIMLVFLAVYLAWLSPVACVIALGFAGVALGVRFSRMVSLGKAMQAAQKAELAVFNGLTDLLGGFKEVRLSAPRAAGLVGHLREVSGGARRVNSDTKKQWGREFALLQSLFYVLIGLMAFAVPLFTQGFHEVVVRATMVALFIIGPVGTLAYVTPMITQTEFALANIEAMLDRLRQSSGEAVEAAAHPYERAPSSIALREASYAYRENGSTVFRVGPLSAEFRAGQITFITGGNGSGKSTLLRLLTGLVPLGAGSLLVDGEEAGAEHMQGYRDLFSAIFSDNHLSRRLYGLGDPDPARVRQLLERLEMAQKVGVRDGAFSTIDLSAGQRKRAAMVVTLLADKPVIVLDEWAAGQDPYFRRVFYEKLLPELKAQGKIIICVTHDDRWFHLADQVLRMKQGSFAAAPEVDLAAK